MSFWRRFGGFLIALGILCLVLFVMSDIAGQMEAAWMLGGAALVGLGILLRISHPAPQAQPNPRFRILKKRKDEPQPKKEARHLTAEEKEKEKEEESSRKRKPGRH